MSLLIVNAATRTQQVDYAVSLLKSHAVDYHVMDMNSLRLDGCKGCYVCMLVTPGKCCIRDDGEELLRQIVQHDHVVFLFDTALNFINHKGINLINRMFPLVSMVLEPRDREILHIPRYDTVPKIGFLYTGDADSELVNGWLTRVTVNYGASSMKARPIEDVAEVCQWIS